MDLNNPQNITLGELQSFGLENANAALKALRKHKECTDDMNRDAMDIIKQARAGKGLKVIMELAKKMKEKHLGDKE